MKKYLISILIFGLFTSLLPVSLIAQESEDIKTSFERVQRKCEKKPLADRIRAVVARFNVTAPNRTYELGENMATMLSSSLYKINCFQMLSMKKNQADLEGEIYGDGNYNTSSLADQGEMLGAQIVITGEITEFSIKNKSVGIGVLRTSKEIVKLGFVLNMIDPATRRILWQESVNVEGKAAGSTSLGLGIPRLGRINLGETSSDNPAVANAFEQGVLRASELLVESINEIEMPKGANPNLKSTMIVVDKVGYMDNKSLAAMVEKLEGVEEVKATFSNEKGQLRVRHAGNTESFMDALYSKINASFRIVEVVPGQIVLAKK